MISMSTRRSPAYRAGRRDGLVGRTPTVCRRPASTQADYSAGYAQGQAEARARRDAASFEARQAAALRQLPRDEGRDAFQRMLG